MGHTVQNKLGAVELLGSRFSPNLIFTRPGSRILRGVLTRGIRGVSCSSSSSFSKWKMASFFSIPQEARQNDLTQTPTILISADVLITGAPVDDIQSRNALILED